MDCAAICLLTTAVQFLPMPSTSNCTYCVEARSTYEHCFKDVIECAYRDPSSLIICLNVYEKNGGDLSIIQHTVRCISYQDYYVPDKSIEKIADSGSCAYEHIQNCECDVCHWKTTTRNLTKPTTEITPTMHRKKHQHHHHYHKDKDGWNRSQKHDQLIYPNNTFAQQYRDSGYYLKSSRNQSLMYSFVLSVMISLYKLGN